MIMICKRTVVTFLAVSMLAMVGCAAKSAISQFKQDNVITYIHDATAQSVTVAIEAPYVYEEFVERKFEGVIVKGYLFKNGTDAILVTKMVRGEFEQLVGGTLDAPLSGIKPFPPKTIYENAFCELVRAYVVTFEKEVVAAVKVKSLNPEKKPCEEWLTLDDVMADLPEVVIEFDKSADAVILLKWK